MEFRISCSNLPPIYFIIGSLFVLIFAIFLGAQHYTERALAMRNCYIQLDNIYWKAKRAEAESSVPLIEKLESDYANTLLGVENHTDFDYLSFRYSVRKNKQIDIPKLTRVECLSYIYQKGWRLASWIILLLLPAIIFALMVEGSVFNVGV